MRLVNRKRKEYRRTIRRLDWLTIVIIYCGVKSNSNYLFFISLVMATVPINKSYELSRKEKELKRQFRHLYD